MRTSSTASSSSSRWPLVEIITGSTTTGMRECTSNRPHTSATSDRVASMPVLTALTSKSSSTDSICAVTTSGLMVSTVVMPTVFCAVTAVMAHTPCTW